MLPFLIVGGAVMGGLVVVEALAGAAGAVETFGIWRKKKEMEENMKIGINPFFEEHRVAKMAEMVKKGMPPVGFQETEFIFFKLSPEDLPKEMHYLTQVKWVLTPKERISLYAMMRVEMLNRGIGSFGQKMKALCEKHGIPYRELGKIGWEGSPVDYEELTWLSEQRLNNTGIAAQKPADW